MGFLDELRKLTQPYDDDDDYFEDSEVSTPAAAPASAAQIEFENAFGADPSEPEPARKAPKQASEPSGLLGALGVKKAAPRPKPARRERTVSFGGNETQVILFNPKTFDEAGELVSHLQQNRSVVMTLEGLPTDNARRLLDFLSGITFALQGKITPVSAKTYFVTPQNVDLVGSQADQPESDGQYF